jgi:hypothetical protein
MRPLDPHYIKWYNRYWHDWPRVYDAAYEAAAAQARYLGYDVQQWGRYAPPPGDLAEIGPVMRITLYVFAPGRRNKEPPYDELALDVTRRGHTFRAAIVSAELR